MVSERRRGRGDAGAWPCGWTSPRTQSLPHHKTRCRLDAGEPLSSCRRTFTTPPAALCPRLDKFHGKIGKSGCGSEGRGADGELWPPPSVDSPRVDRGARARCVDRTRHDGVAARGRARAHACVAVAPVRSGPVDRSGGGSIPTWTGPRFRTRQRAATAHRAPVEVFRDGVTSDPGPW